MKKAVYFSFFAYFAILLAERLQSLVRIFCDGDFVFSPYDYCVVAIAVLSILCTIVLFAPHGGRSLIANVADPDFKRFSVTAGVILVSGMVHTEYTIPALQFAAYGALIVGMIIKCAAVAKRGERFCRWYSLAYLVAFSMAIPVMYRTRLECHVLFHVLEVAAVFVLVASFTYMMRKLFDGAGGNLLMTVPFLLMVLFDAALIAIRWEEEVNMFVLIFASLSALLFIAGKIIFALIKKK